MRPSPRVNPALEAEILAVEAAGGDGTAARLVYADWLLSNGDPRGELAMLQDEIGRRPGDAGLLERQAALLASHPDLLGEPLAEPGHEKISWEWRLGFLDRLEIRSRTFMEAPPEDRGPRILRIVDQPSARLLRTLTIDSDAAPIHHVLSALAGRPRPSVRSLEIHGGIERGDEALLSRAFPSLRALRLSPTVGRPDLLDLPALQELEIPSPTDPEFRPPANAPGYRILDGPVWTAFGEGTGLPRLETLRLLDDRGGLITILARSPLCRRLRTLAVDVSSASEIIQNADLLRHLLIDGGDGETLEETERELYRLKLDVKGFRGVW